MHQRFVEIPHTLLQAPTLAALLEVFVTRQGYDTSSEESSRDWVEDLRQQLQQGQLVILHDVETEMTEIMTLEQSKRFLGDLDE